MSDKPVIRNTERTRRAILDAARSVIREKGTSAALGAIAEMAGVTKGGLLHHFSGRDALLLSVAQDALDQLRTQVLARIDLSENHPGQLLRAYIRTLFDTDEETRAHFDYLGLWGTLYVVPGVTELLQEDANYWRSSFGEDGLHPDRVLFAQHAAEGIVASMQWDPGLTPDAVADALTRILALTNDNGPIGATI